MRISPSVPFVLSVLLTGCTAAPVLTSNTSPSESVRGLAISGKVHGGQNPISGARVYLYAVGNTGYGGPAVSLLTSGTQDGSGNYYVTTASDGSFSVTGDYACPVANAYAATYILAIGGDSGSGNNPAISMVAPIGDCTSPNYTSTYVIVNEITTIASEYAAGGIITDLTHVSAPNTALALTALDNIDTGNLYDKSSAARTATQGGNGTVPQDEINTLANIVAACVNSNGVVSASPTPTPCYTLFSNALSSGTTGTMPSDTATAALNIARNPGANVANLFNLQTASAPFQPVLGAAPNDFTIAISYTGGALNHPEGIAVDGAGDIWVANSGGSSLSEFSYNGSVLGTFTGGGLTTPSAIAFDGSGNAWASNQGTGSISEFSPAGSPMSPATTGFTGGGLSDARGLAADALGNIWVVGHSSNILSEFDSSDGSPVSATGYTTGGLDGPLSVAIDTGGNVWVTNAVGDTLSEFDSSGGANNNSPWSGGGLINPEGIGVGLSNDVWVADGGRGNNLLSEFNSSGAVSLSGYSGGGLSGDATLAIDGSGNVWVTNFDSGSLSEFSPSGTAITGSTGYQNGLSAAIALAIDGDGNVWVTYSGTDSISEFVGLARPVVTPIVANLLPPYGAHAVNLP
jgi:DNA-binding beta-propeller fold protein YncE